MERGFFRRLWAWLKRKMSWRISTKSVDDETLLQILHSEIEWRRARNLYISAHYECAMCGIRKKLEVHHVVPYHVSEKLRYDQSNLITLCRECHFRFGHGRNWHKSNPDVRNLCKQAQESLSHVS